MIEKNHYFVSVLAFRDCLRFEMLFLTLPVTKIKKLKKFTWVVVAHCYDNCLRTGRFRVRSLAWANL